MALFKKDNLPVAVPMNGSGWNSNNLTGEAQKIVELSLKTDRSTSGNVSWTSTTSNVTYSTTDGYNNQGEDGLLKLLINRFGDTDSESIPSFLLTKTNFNDVVDAVQALQTSVSNITGGTTTVARATTANSATTATTATTATKLANTSAIGSATQPVYFTSGGVPQACTAYASATVGTATKLSNTTAVGSASNPVYFSNAGVPVACTMANLSVGTASKLGSSTLGSTTKPIYLSTGTATECSTYAGGTKVTLNGTAKGGSTASFYAPTSYGTSGYFLKSNGENSAPTWVSASTLRNSIGLGNTTGTLAVSNGGTGATTFTSGNLLVGNGTGAIGTIAKSAPNVASTVVVRDSNGDFAGRNISAANVTVSGEFVGSLTGTASNATGDNAGNTISTYYCHVFSGSGTPSASTGKVGDLYIVI